MILLLYFTSLHYRPLSYVFNPPLDFPSIIFPDHHDVSLQTRPLPQQGRPRLRRRYRHLLLNRVLIPQTRCFSAHHFPQDRQHQQGHLDSQGLDRFRQDHWQFLRRAQGGAGRSYSQVSRQQVGLDRHPCQWGGRQLPRSLPGPLPQRLPDRPHDRHCRDFPLIQVHDPTCYEEGRCDT